MKDFLKLNYNIDLFIYDKYNRNEIENNVALLCKPDLIICNNVLNVIDSIEVISSLVHFIEGFNKPFYISVYEGNRSNTGHQTSLDSYQRNEQTKEYLQYFKNAKMHKNMIISK